MNAESAPGDRAREREVLTVTELNRAVATLLERNVPPVWVQGELSNVMRAASGHWYLTLKDDNAQVRAVMFRHRAQAIGFEPRNGDQVEVRALAGMYQPRGEFQLNVETMRRAGAGGLYQRFVQLREKLRDEGLLDAARKRALPPLPRRVGIITSAQAAALRDVLTTLARRAPQVPVVLYPTPVQGADAPRSIRAALAAAIRRAECEVLLLVRGGGSIEDLWAFNDEALAREIAASPIPVICGVGHESDFTIADFVADHRAATPTAAAQAAVPERRELAHRCALLAQRSVRAFARTVATREQRVDTAARLLRPPSAQWRERARRLEALEWRLGASARAPGARADERL
ncbi:MAG TPA: exodeoxyribonuclease VII large subunit, partial [Burkholderiaceae bacterium]